MSQIIWCDWKDDFDLRLATSAWMIYCELQFWLITFGNVVQGLFVTSDAQINIRYLFRLRKHKKVKIIFGILGLECRMVVGYKIFGYDH